MNIKFAVFTVSEKSINTVYPVTSTAGIFTYLDVNTYAHLSVISGIITMFVLQRLKTTKRLSGLIEYLLNIKVFFEKGRKIAFQNPWFIMPQL